MSFIVKQSKDFKIFKSEQYNYIFNKHNGALARWGKNKDHDPDWCQFGPEIADIEISKGKCSGNCGFCYKGNGTNQVAQNMTLDQFKTILSKLTDTLTQIAFGICDIDTNPNMWTMFEHARNNGIIPNYTCNGFNVTNEVAKRTAQLCGAVAVSIVDKLTSLSAICRFIDNGCKQVNIHYMLSKQTYERAFEIVNTIKDIKGFQAVVFLQYKPKGRNKDKYDSLLEPKDYRRLVDYCDENDVSYGFDSCSCHLYLQCIKDKQDYDKIRLFTEPCESSAFSLYANCDGIFFPCSFLEGEAEWNEGLDLLHCDNFIQDVWMHPKTVQWRNKLLNNKRMCPHYFMGGKVSENTNSVCV